MRVDSDLSSSEIDLLLEEINLYVLIIDVIMDD